jgi:hypothetical protein
MLLLLASKAILEFFLALCGWWWRTGDGAFRFRLLSRSRSNGRRLLSRVLVATAHGDGFVGGGFLSSPFGGRATVVAETASEASQPGARVRHNTSQGGPACCLLKIFFFQVDVSWYYGGRSICFEYNRDVTRGTRRVGTRVQMSSIAVYGM